MPVSDFLLYLRANQCDILGAGKDHRRERVLKMALDTKIAALILAAGYSSRMGEFKPLLPLGASTVMEEAVERFRRAGIEDIRVICGHRADELRPVIARLGIRGILNSRFERGMYSSVLAGVESLEAEIEAFFVLPVDVPLVKPATIAALAASYRQTRPKIVYPRFEGLRGHPPVISTELAAKLPDDCEGGLAAFLGGYEEEAADLDVIDQAVLMNCNTRLDYLKLKAYRSREEIPAYRECMALLKGRNATGELISHCQTVAEAARMLAVELYSAGLDPDFELVGAAGLLHDLAKGLAPDHAEAGARFLETIGYSRVASAVASHTDIEPERQACPDEADIVHLADKFVKGDKVVSLEERFEGALKKFAARPEVLEAVQRRLRNARTINARFENILGVSPHDLVGKYGALMRAAVGGPRNIYLARHGAVEHQSGVKCYIGQTDLCLSKEGIEQAEKLAAKLRPIPLTAIFSSDLGRASDTAKIIGALHGIETTAMSSFREIALGDWEGLTFEDVRRLHPAEYEQRGRDIAHFRPSGGESFTDCARRVIPAFRDAIYSTRGDILIVAHAGVNRILLCFAMGKPLSELFEIEQDYCCLNRIGCRDFSLELESLNEPLSLVR